MTFLAIRLFYAAYRGWILLALWGVVAAGVVGFYAWRVHVERDVGREEVRAEVRDRAARETEASNKESFRRIARQKESQDAYTAEISRARADAAGATAAAQRLSVRLAQFVAAGRAAAANSSTGGEREAGSSPLDLLADLFSRADGEAGILAEALDRSYAAGQLCARSYDALTVKP